MIDDVAYIVENDVILNALYSTIGELGSKVNVLTGTKAVDYYLPTNDSKLVTVDLDNNVKLKTKLLVCCLLILFKKKFS